MRHEEALGAIPSLSDAKSFTRALVMSMCWISSWASFSITLRIWIQKGLCLRKHLHVEGMLRDYVDMKEEQADRDIRPKHRMRPAPESVRIQGRNVHRRGQSSEDPCQKAP